MNTKKTSLYLYFSTFTANLVFFTSGVIVAWNSPTIPKLRSNDTNVNPFGKPISVHEESLVTGIIPFGALLGVLILGKIPDLIGRRKSLIYLQAILVLSCVGLAFATNFYVYLVLTALLSLSNFATDTVAPVYLVEITQDHNRGKLGSLVSFGIALGQFYVYLIGPITSVRAFCLLSSLPSALFLLLSAFIPESPNFFRLKRQNVNTTLSLITHKKENTPFKNEKDSEEDEESTNRVGFFNIFKCRSGKKAFFLSLIIKVLHQMSGLFVIMSFMGTLLNDTSIGIPGSTLAAAVSSVKIIGAVLVYNIIERVGRRILLLMGSSVCGFALLILGLHFFFKENNIVLPEYLKFTSIFALALFIFCFNVGVSSVALTASSEILPDEHRVVGTFLGTTITCTGSVGISLAYPLVVKYLGTHYAMFTFSVIFFSCFGFIYKFLPEMKGKSLDEIKKLLQL